MKFKRCRKCKRRRRISQYYKDPRNPERTLARCKECLREDQTNWYRNNTASKMLHAARTRSKAKGWDFDLEVQDLEPLPTHCPIFGIELRASAGPRDFQAYSLDRVDNSKGYVRGNVVVMSYLANRLKNDGTAEQHEKIAAWMRSQGQR